jgi:4-hydroxybenzoate polyprenyltransferase
MDFRKLLEFEEKFFASLFKLPEYEGGAGAEIRGPGSRWTWAGAGLGLALGAAFGYLAYAANQDADREYDRFQAARSREAAQSRQAKVEEKERSSILFGVMGGASLVGAGGLLVFSF